MNQAAVKIDQQSAPALARWIRPFVLGCAAFGFFRASACAEPPKMAYLFPAGARQGDSVEVKVGDASDPWPAAVWVSDPALQITPAEEKGKLTIAVSPEATPGVYWLRLYTPEGATGLRPFFVGTLAEVAEAEPNNSPSESQAFDATALLVNGTLERSGDIDLYAVQLTAGQTLVASLEANHRLGSPMDAVLQIVSERGFVLDQNDEYHGVDPQIVFTAPEDGKYLVRTFAFPSQPNSTIGFAGGASYIYRLTLTTGAFADHPFPLAVSREGTRAVHLQGWNVPDDVSSRVLEPTADPLAKVTDARLGNVVTVRLEPHPATVEQEPNDAASPNELVLPQTVSGRIESPGDVDVYRFRADQGQTLRFEIASRELGYPLDPVLRVLDATGKELKREDDQGRNVRDSRLDFQVPEAGEYRLEVSDLYGTGGFRYVYLLRAVSPQPDYALTVEADHFAANAGKPLEIPVAIDRQDGFKEPVEITVEGLPEGVTVEAVTSPAEGDAAKSVKLKLNATTATTGGPIRIVGRVASQPPFDRTATAALADFHTRTSQLWLTVLKPEEKKEEPKDEKE